MGEGNNAMLTRLKLAPNAERLLVILTWQLRIVADELVTNPEFNRSHAMTMRQLLRLEEDGWLHRGQIAAAIPELDGELVTWTPREEQADFGKLSWCLKERGRRWQPRILRVCWSTAQAVTVFGGVGGRIRQPLQVQHDIGVAAMFFCRSAFAFDPRSVWVGEDVVRRIKTDLGTKVPDALLLGAGLTPRRAIEFGGSYSPGRLQKFHDFCESQRLPYEIW